MSASANDHDVLNAASRALTVPRPLLACHVCKRRKSKCDRTLPSCSTCLKSTQRCEYPAAAQKPGPKTGIVYQSKKRNRPDLEVDDIQCSRVLKNTKSNRGALRIQSSPNTMDSPQLCHQRQSPTQFSHAEFRSGISRPLKVSVLPSPVSTINTTPSYDRCYRGNSTLIEIIHPSHEPVPQPSLVLDQHEYDDQETQTARTKHIVQNVCDALHISTSTYHHLRSAYFENMMSFSLFHQPSFDAKLHKISSQVQRHALLAAMFSFSARFGEKLSTEEDINIPSPENFQEIATRLVNDALEECSDNTPPLCILQAMILTNFQQLATGVRGRAWRSLGACIRIAYELELHLIDHMNDRDQDFRISKNVERWVLEEERRRAWWALWESDAFASTIRRLPTAIDWLRNETWLPIEDENWFANKFSPSCYLVIDPHQRWKVLEKSGNKSGRAWFIVINSLMRSAQTIWGTSRRNPQPINKSKGDSTPISKSAEEAENEMSAVSDAICCFSMALPLSLSHRGEFLSFRSSKFAATKSSRQNDSDKYSIHIMKQLSRFMVYHHRVFRSVGRENGNATPKGNVWPRDSPAKGPSQGVWSRYLDAADNIIAVIRNSSSDHIQNVNPYLASTIWLAAAAQVASRTFGPTVTDPKVVEANLDLLRLTFGRFVSFWNLSDILQERLNSLESRLQNLLSIEHGAAQVIPQVKTVRHETSMQANRQVADEPQSNDHIEDFASMSSYFPPESAFSPTGVSTYDLSDPLSASGANFGGFPISGYENWDSFELEELLTYGYDGNGVIGLA